MTDVQENDAIFNRKKMHPKYEESVINTLCDVLYLTIMVTNAYEYVSQNRDTQYL